MQRTRLQVASRRFSWLHRIHATVPYFVSQALQTRARRSADHRCKPRQASNASSSNAQIGIAKYFVICGEIEADTDMYPRCISTPQAQRLTHVFLKHRSRQY